jgi:SAM-dependent methyltransferase
MIDLAARLFDRFRGGAPGAPPPFVLPEVPADEALISEAGKRLLEAGAETQFDARRIATTVHYARAFGLTEGMVADIGGSQHPTSRALWSFFPGTEPVETRNDLRCQTLPFRDGSVDAAFCLEVIEHLSDPFYGHATTLSGVRYFLGELHRVLRFGGRALVTTPNAASLWTIQRALLGQPPMMYEWHFREFTVGELRQLAEHAGFSVVQLQTEFVWYRWDFGPIVDLLSRHGYSAADRGDDIFLVIQKDSGAQRKPLSIGLPV